jgi:subtilisin family serine protease
VERAIEECSRKGTRGWTNYVATLAAVGKGIGGPEPIQHSEAYSAPSGEAGPRVAVIDTGIPMAQRGDGWLNGVPRNEGDIDQLDVLPAGPDGFLDFQAGHGTFVSGIVMRVAPGADVRVYKAADSDGFASDDMIADALLRAYEDGAQVINMSLGMRTTDDEPPPALAAAAQYITQDSGGAVVMVAAAGNFGDDAPCWPAALPGVEAVAGLKADLTPAQWSSHGDVQFSTVAEGIRSTFVTGLESPVFDREPEEFGNDSWALWSGTSFAAPQIAGAIVRICRETPGTTPRQAVALLASGGQPISGFGSAMQILEGVL